MDVENALRDCQTRQDHHDLCLGGRGGQDGGQDFPMERLREEHSDDEFIESFSREEV